MFKPPERMLKSIGYGLNLIGKVRTFENAWLEFTIPTFQYKHRYDYVSGAIVGLIKTFFATKIGNEDRLEQINVDRMILESLSNSAKHGNKGENDKLINLWIGCGEKGFLIGLKDEGSYFHQPAVKELFERRIRPKKSLPGKEAGLSWIFDPDSGVRDIFIDIERGIFYFSVLIESILSPIKLR